MAGIPVLARCPLAGPFAAATAVEPAAAGEWVASIDPGWEIAGNANGGYLLAMATRALTIATGRPDPVTVTAHYLSPGPPGSVRIATQILKEGKRFATGTATMFSGTRPLLAVLGTLGDLSQAEGPELVEGGPPELPSPEQCVRVRPTGTFPPPFMGHVDLRLHPDDAAFATGRQSGQPLMRGWFRLPGAEPIDSIALLCAVDAFRPPPSTPGCRSHGRRRSSSPPISGRTQRPDGSAAAFRPGSSPPVSSRRTAKSGTAPGAWLASRVNSPLSPGADIRLHPDAHVPAAGGRPITMTRRVGRGPGGII